MAATFKLTIEEVLAVDELPGTWCGWPDRPVAPNVADLYFFLRAVVRFFAFC